VVLDQDPGALISLAFIKQFIGLFVSLTLLTFTSGAQFLNSVGVSGGLALTQIYSQKSSNDSTLLKWNRAKGAAYFVDVELYGNDLMSFYLDVGYHIKHSTLGVVADSTFVSGTIHYRARYYTFALRAQRDFEIDEATLSLGLGFHVNRFAIGEVTTESSNIDPIVENLKAMNMTLAGVTAGVTLGRTYGRWYPNIHYRFQYNFQPLQTFPVEGIDLRDRTQLVTIGVAYSLRED
jgi:hypothetical protein